MNAMSDPTAFQHAAALDREAERLGRSVPITPTSAAWLVVITKAGKERAVHDRLVAQGFEVCLPLRPLNHRLFRLRGVSAVPMFPRMLFARATLDAYRWQAIFSTIGVSRVLCDPERPKGLKPAFIEAVRARVLDGFLAIGCIDPAKPPPPAKAKDRRQWVKLADVVDGIFAEGVDSARGSLLVSVLSEGHDAVTQTIRRH